MGSIYQDRIQSPWHSRTFGNTLTLTVDGSVTAMSMSPWGRDVALAGRKGLYIIDLYNPFSPPRWVRHLTSWEVADVQWSPHKHRPHWVISSSNQVGIIWNLSRPSSNAHEYILHGHERAITDINFHNAQPDMLATCSVDTQCFVWDIRTSASKPVFVCSDWESAASQIKWNHKNEYVFASAHGERINIWDIRKGNTPLFRIRAHDGKINGLNYNKNKEMEIISCANDCTVKSWDYSSGKLELNYTIKTNFPVLKARYLPFGKAMGILPLREGKNALSVIDVPAKGTVTTLDPIHQFIGHLQPVNEFLWCRRYPHNDKNNNEFQLVTWSKDKDLRLWKIENSFNEKVHYNYKGPQTEKDRELTNHLKSFKYVTYRSEPHTLSNWNRGKITNILTSDVNWLTSNIEVNDHLLWISNVRTEDLPEAASNNQDPYNLGKELRLTHGKLSEEFADILLEEIYVTEGRLVFSLYSPVLNEMEDLIVGSEKDRPQLEKEQVVSNKEVVETEDKSEPPSSKESDVPPAADDLSNPKESELVFLRINVIFPKGYPQSHSPTFTVEHNHDTTKKQRENIKTLLEYIAQKCVSVSNFCLEQVFQFLAGRQVDIDDILDQGPESEVNDGFNDGVLLNEITDDNEDLVDDNEDSDYDFDIIHHDDDDDDDDDHSPIDEMVDSYMPDLRSAGPSEHFNTPPHILCGARWAPNGQLIFFTNFENRGRKCEEVSFKPKAYYGGHQQGYRLSNNKLHVQNILNANFYQESDSQDSDDSDASIEQAYLDGVRLQSGKVNGKKKEFVSSDFKRINNVVTMLDFGRLLPSKPELAECYTISGGNAFEIADTDAKGAGDLLLKDGLYGEDLLEVSNVWDIIKVIVMNKQLNHGLDDDFFSPLLSSEVFDPLAGSDWQLQLAIFGSQWLIKNIVKFYEGKHDVQMLAMISCVFLKFEESSNDELTEFHKPAELYNSPFVSEITVINAPSVQLEITLNLARRNDFKMIFDQALLGRLKKYRDIYSDMLLSWGLPLKRVEILKYNYSLSDITGKYTMFEVGFEQYPEKLLVCDLCSIPVKRQQIQICNKCQHVLHSKCAQSWWKSIDNALADHQGFEEECPTGCGCRCLKHL